MIVFFPLHKITKYKQKRYDCSDRFYCCFRNRAVPICLGIFNTYRKLNSHSCIYRLNLAAKNTERRAGLRFDRIHEKLNYPKRFTDNIEKKIKDDLFFIKTIGLGSRRFHCFTEFFTGTSVRSAAYKLRHIVFHAALIHLLKIYFQV